MITEQELEGLKSQLQLINSDLELYSEEEHLEVEKFRTDMRNLIRFYGNTAELAIIAISLEITIRKAMN